MSQEREMILHVIFVFFLLNSKLGQPCVFKYGSLNGTGAEGMEHSSHMGGTSWTYDFAGLDWVGVDASGAPWACPTGSFQSPVDMNNLKALPKVPLGSNAVFNLGSILSDGTNVQVINNGHTIQVEWSSGPWFQPNVSVILPGTNTRTTVTPLQFHFHTHSEHTIQGSLYPLEMHIVSRAVGAPGCSQPLSCLVVLGIMFQEVTHAQVQVDTESEYPNQDIQNIWDVMPLNGGDSNMLPAGKVLNFSSLLPSNRSYVTYSGSLTTPPCSEGVLWHVLTSTQTISLHQYEDFLIAVGDYECPAGNVVPLVQGRVARAMLGAPAAVVGPAGGNFSNDTAGNCTKLGAGANFRIMQHLNRRPQRIWIDAPTSQEGESGSGSGGGGANMPNWAVALLSVGVAIAASVATAIGFILWNRGTITDKKPLEGGVLSPPLPTQVPTDVGEVQGRAKQPLWSTSFGVAVPTSAHLATAGRGRGGDELSVDEGDTTGLLSVPKGPP